MKLLAIVFCLAMLFVWSMAAQDCTKFREEVKTLSDKTADEVVFKRVHSVTTLDLFNLDHVTYRGDLDYTKRIPGVEWAVFRVRAKLVEIAGRPLPGGDGDYDLRLETPTHVHHPLVIEFPPEGCVKNSKYKNLMMSALQQLHRECDPVDKCVNKIVEVTGVGFWDISKEKNADGYFSSIELHPVLSFKVCEPETKCGR